MAINIALKYLVIYLLSLYRWNPAESAGSVDTLAQSIASKYSTHYTVDNGFKKNSQESKYNVQTIEEAKAGSTRSHRSYRTKNSDSLGEQTSEAESPKRVPKHLKSFPEEYKLKPRPLVSASRPQLDLIALDVKDKVNTNQVTYSYEQDTDVDRFLVRDGYALRKVTKGDFVIWEAENNIFGYEVLIIPEDGDKVCRVNFKDYASFLPKPPEQPAPKPAYAAPQMQHKSSTSGISVPSDGPGCYRNQYHMALDINEKYSLGPISYKMDPGKHIEIFIIKEPYSFYLILKGTRVLWHYTGGDFPCAALLKRDSKGRQKLKVFFSRDLSFVGLPKDELGQFSDTLPEPQPEVPKPVPPKVENLPQYTPMNNYDVQYTPMNNYEVQFTLNMLSASVDPLASSQYAYYPTQTLIEGRDYINVDMAPPGQHIGPQPKPVIGEDNLIHTIEIDLSPKKTPEAPDTSSKSAPEEDGDGIVVDDSRKQKEEPLHSGDDKPKAKRAGPPVVETVYSDDGIHVVDPRSPMVHSVSPGEEVIIERRRRPMYMPVSAGQVASPCYTGIPPQPQMFPGPPCQGPQLFCGQAPQVSPSVLPQVQVVESTPYGMPMPMPTPGLRGAARQPRFQPTEGGYYVDQIPITPTPTPSKTVPPLRIEGAAEIQEVFEDEELVEEVFESESDKENVDVVVVTAPKGKKVTLEDIKGKEKEAKQAQTKESNDQKVAAVLSKARAGWDQGSITKSTDDKTKETTEKPKVTVDKPMTTPPKQDDQDIFNPMSEPVYSSNAHLPLSSLTRPRRSSVSSDTDVPSSAVRVTSASGTAVQGQGVAARADSTRQSVRKYVKLPTGTAPGTTDADKTTKPGPVATQPVDPRTPTPGQSPGLQPEPAQKSQSDSSEDSSVTYEDDDIFTEWYSPIFDRIPYPKDVEIPPPNSYSGAPIGYDDDIFSSIYTPIYTRSSPLRIPTSTDSDLYDIFSTVYEPFVSGSRPTRPTDQDDIFSTVYEPYFGRVKSLVEKPREPAQGLVNPLQRTESQKAAAAQGQATDDDDIFSEWYVPTFSSVPASTTINLEDSQEGNQATISVGAGTTPVPSVQASSNQATSSILTSSTPPGDGSSSVATSSNSTSLNQGTIGTSDSGSATTPTDQTASSSSTATADSDSDFDIEDSSISQQSQLKIYTLKSDNTKAENDATQYTIETFGVTKNMKGYTFNSDVKCVEVKFDTKRWEYDPNMHSGKYPEKVIHNTSNNTVVVDMGGNIKVTL
nr:hypothetical protein MACL_00002541 [Theileria orientalis]